MTQYVNFTKAFLTVNES